jgi:hypothetical protein
MSNDRQLLLRQPKRLAHHGQKSLLAQPSVLLSDGYRV